MVLAPRKWSSVFLRIAIAAALVVAAKFIESPLFSAILLVCGLYLGAVAVYKPTVRRTQGQDL